MFRGYLCENNIMTVHESQFSDSLDRPYAGTPAKTVLIASTPRCGSHILGQAMGETGRLGVPFDYSDPATATEWARRMETTTPEATLAELMARRTTPNGIFGILSHHEHGVVFGSTEKLLRQLPGLKVVHLRRGDVLRQAVSFAIAKQTGVWANGQDGTGEAPAYDPGLIDHCLNDIAVQNALWTSLFRKLEIKPLEIMYETALTDMPKTVDAIARFSGAIEPGEALDVTQPRILPELERRAEDWIERYADDRLARRAILRRIGGLARRAWPGSGQL